MGPIELPRIRATTASHKYVGSYGSSEALAVHIVAARMQCIFALYSVYISFLFLNVSCNFFHHLNIFIMQIDIILLL